MTRALSFALLLTMIAFPARAADPGPHIQIPAGGTLNGHFIDDHTFKNTNAPSRFEGHFTVAPDYGVIWYVEKPLPLTITVTSMGMTQNIGGMRLPSISATRLPILSRTTQLLSDALMGNWQSLEKDFIVTHDAVVTGWQATLTPRTDAQIPVKTIAVAGDQFVNAATAVMPNGSMDNFAFSDQHVSATPPTAAEVAAFNDANAPQH